MLIFIETLASILFSVVWKKGERLTTIISAVQKHVNIKISWQKYFSFGYNSNRSNMSDLKALVWIKLVGAVLKIIINVQFSWYNNDYLFLHLRRHMKTELDFHNERKAVLFDSNKAISMLVR